MLIIDNIRTMWKKFYFLCTFVLWLFWGIFHIREHLWPMTCFWSWIFFNSIKTCSADEKNYNYNPLVVLSSRLQAIHSIAWKSHFNSLFPFQCSELLSLHKARVTVWKSPQWTGRNAVPITAAAGVRPWQQASKLPKIGCKMTNYLTEGWGEGT